MGSATSAPQNPPPEIMLDPHEPSPMSEVDLERVRTQLREALERLRDTVERTQRAFYEMRLRVAESTSDNPAFDDGRAFASTETAPRSAVEVAFREQILREQALENEQLDEPSADEKLGPWPELPSRTRRPSR
jgi:hypothetical protein